MPRILLTSKSDIGLAFIPWAQERYKLRSGIWYDAPHEKVLIQYNTVAGTILIKAEAGQNLVCNPYKTDKDNYSSHFFLDATKDKIFSTETDESWKENLPTDVEVELVDEALFGNYIVSDSDGNNYSIIAPTHHLANEPNNQILIPSYTRYAWTTNVTGVDIHTCYSEYVYSGGEPIFRGTYAPPEAEFQSALIVGLGLDGEGNIHVAQLSGIGKDIGYWTILDKNKVSVGVYFGSEDGAKAEAGKLEKGTYSKIWKNETSNRWFIEFHSTNCSDLTGLLPADLNIYRREPANRIGAGANRQWFYIDNQWIQYSTAIPATLEFKGLMTENSLKKTEYLYYPKTEINGLFNGKPVSITHKALSWSGVQGLHKDKLLNAYKQATGGIQFAASSSPVWPNDGAYYVVSIQKDDCVDSVTVTCTLPNTTVSTIEEGREYRVTLNTNGRCVADKSSELVSGAIFAKISISGSVVAEDSMPISYTSKVGYWSGPVLHRVYTCSEVVVSETITGNQKVILRRCSSPQSGGEATSYWLNCRYCSNQSPLTYKAFEENITTPLDFGLGATFAYTGNGSGILYTKPNPLPSCSGSAPSPDCPCCEGLSDTKNTIYFWYVHSSTLTYTWVCS